MKVVFHENFKRSDYASDGASVPGRMESIMTALKANGYIVISPEPASFDDLLLAHTQAHIADIQKNRKLFEMPPQGEPFLLPILILLYVHFLLHMHRSNYPKDI